MGVRGFEGAPPCGVEVDGIDQHEAGVVGDRAGAEQVLDAILRLPLYPRVDGLPRTLRVLLELEQPDVCAVFERQRVQERRLDGVALLGKELVRSGESEGLSVGAARPLSPGVQLGIQIIHRPVVGGLVESDVERVHEGLLSGSLRARVAHRQGNRDAERGDEEVLTRVGGELAIEVEGEVGLAADRAFESAFGAEA